MATLANTGRAIISEMFRYGVIDENSSYMALDLRSMSDGDVFSTIGKMIQQGLITHNTEENPRAYYVHEDLIFSFIDQITILNT